MLTAGIAYSTSEVGIPGPEGSVNRTARHGQDIFVATTRLTNDNKSGNTGIVLTPEIGYVKWRDNTFWTSLDESMGTSHGGITYLPNSYGETQSDLYIVHASCAADICLSENLGGQITLQGKHSQIITTTHVSGYPHGDWPGNSQELSLAGDFNGSLPIGPLRFGATVGGGTKATRSATQGGRNDALEMTVLPSDTISNLSVYSDAGIRAFGGYLYVIERFGADNIMKFDPSKSDQSGAIYQMHLGDNWNPQDMEFVSATKAYISNMNEPKITVYNPMNGKVIINIDISTYTFQPDSNTSPHASDLQLVGSDLYVMLQRRNGFKPGAPTLILKINTSTDDVTDTIALQFKNGYAMAYADGALYVSNPGSAYTAGDGGIEKVVLSTKTVSTVVDETALSRSPNQIVHKSDSRFYVTNYIGWKNVKVVELDVETGTIVSTLPNIKDAFGGIYYDDVDGKLYVGERDSVEMGVRVFKENVQVGAPIKSTNSLPPTGMVVVR